jgi:hypothetical protein
MLCYIVWARNFSHNNRFATRTATWLPATWVRSGVFVWDIVERGS